MHKKFIEIIGWILALELMGLFIGLITKANIYPWYQSLEKSRFTPQSLVFSIIWPILYAMIALAGYSLLQDRNELKARPLIVLFFVQLLLNWLWTPLFFHFHFIGLSLFCLMLITSFTFIVIYLGKNRFRFASIMLTPYFLWLCFATYLNGVIWFLN